MGACGSADEETKGAEAIQNTIKDKQAADSKKVRRAPRRGFCFCQMKDANARYAHDQCGLLRMKAGRLRPTRARTPLSDALRAGDVARAKERSHAIE
jgi:hypothetical protein